MIQTCRYNFELILIYFSCEENEQMNKNHCKHLHSISSPLWYFEFLAPRTPENFKDFFFFLKISQCGTTLLWACVSPSLRGCSSGSWLRAIILTQLPPEPPQLPKNPFNVTPKNSNTKKEHVQVMTFTHMNCPKSQKIFSNIKVKL